MFLSDDTHLCDIFILIEVIATDVCITTINSEVIVQRTNSIQFMHTVIGVETIGNFSVQALVVVLDSCFIINSISHTSVDIAFVFCVIVTIFTLDVGITSIHLSLPFFKGRLWCSTSYCNTHCCYGY